MALAQPTTTSEEQFLRNMILLSIFLLVFTNIKFLERAYGNVCTSLYQESVSRIFNENELQPIDRLLARKIEEDIAHLSPKGQKKFLEILRSVRFEHIEDILSGSFAHVKIYRRVIFFNQILRGSPLGRIALYHELNHLERMLSKNGHFSPRYYLSRLLNPRGVIKDEIAAHKAEHDFIHQAFARKPSREELSVPTKSELKILEAKMKTTGFIDESGRLLVQDSEKVDTSQIEVWNSYLAGTLLGAFYETKLERAFELERDAYANQYVYNNYLTDQILWDTGLMWLFNSGLAVYLLNM